MPLFNYQEYDIGNSTVVQESDGPMSFEFTTERGFMDNNKLTTLNFVNKETGITVTGKIDFNEKTIAISETSKTWEEVKHKAGGFFSLSSEWRWSEKTYVTQFMMKGVWTIKHNDTTVANFTAAKLHPFKKDELATIEILIDAPPEEIVFVVMALLFSDLQLPPTEKKSFKGAAGELGTNAAGNVAGYVATTAVERCCTIQ